MKTRRTVPPNPPPLVVLLLALLAFARPGSAQPAPEPDTLPARPTITGIHVTGLNGLRPCADDSVRVLVTGVVPSACYPVRSVTLYYPRCIAPCAPRVIIGIGDNTCHGRCPGTPVPFRVEARYGPLPAGSYQQDAALWIADCENPEFEPPTLGHSLTVPFVVRPESLCVEPGSSCLLTSWRERDPTSRCDGILSDEGRARLTMKVRTSAPLRALQGELRLTDPALRIVAVEPVGPAAGMTLVWNPLEQGARFVMFSAGTARIPATPPDQLPPAVLAVVVAVRDGQQAREVSELYDLLVTGANEAGESVGSCPTITLWPVPSARICRSSTTCDANGDGRLNVSDLVRMLMCLQASCPDSTRFDCNADQDFDLDDVICCARRLLQSGHGPLAPDRPGGSTRVAFGDAERTARGWRVPLRLSEVAHLGAARLTLEFPVDRYALAAVTQQPGAANWLTLSENGPGGLSLGLLNLATGSLADFPPNQLEVVLELELREGRAPGGEVAITGADLSAADGATLDVPMPAALRIPAGIALSAGRPNPSGGSTRFVLGLEQATEVRVTVHDLSGRQVATLFSGPAAAGQRELIWNGRDDRGEALPDGMFFVRGAGVGQVVTQKVILLRQR